MNVCVGTSCFLKGSQKLLHEILDYLHVNGLAQLVNVERLLLLRAVRQGAHREGRRPDHREMHARPGYPGRRRQIGTGHAMRRPLPWLTRPGASRSSLPSRRAAATVTAASGMPGEGHQHEGRPGLCRWRSGASRAARASGSARSRQRSFRQDVEMVQRLVESGRFVAASVAPSFAAVFSGWQRKRLPAALRALGFCYVGQTRRGHIRCPPTRRGSAAENPIEYLCRHRLSRPSSTMWRSTDHDVVGNLLPAGLTHGRPRADAERAPRRGERRSLHRPLRGEEVGGPKARARRDGGLCAHL